MDRIDRREWLLTNGLGSFASGTVSEVRSRVYHGWLIASLEPPGQRRFLLSHLDASLEMAGETIGLGTNIWAGGTIAPEGYRWLQSFGTEPVPTWVWGDGQTWQMMRQLVMPYGVPQGTGPIAHRILARYHYRGQTSALLRLRPIVGDRDFHHTQSSQLSVSQTIAEQQIWLQAHAPRGESVGMGTRWRLRWSDGLYHPDSAWYWHYELLEEAHRGLPSHEDLYSPGYISLWMQSEQTITVEACVGEWDEVLDDRTFEAAVQAECDRLARSARRSVEQSQTLSLSDRPFIPTAHPLYVARDRCIVHTRDRQRTLVAGYHWFGDRTRPTLLALPGFALATGAFDLAKQILVQLGRLCDRGLIPNVVPDTGAPPIRNNIDCALLWIETLGLYLEASQDWEFLRQHYPIVNGIYKAFLTGNTLHNIRIDASDGLLTWDNPRIGLTWMDTMIDGWAVTPRHGKPIEVNALWYSALCRASEWAERLAEMTTAAEQERLQNQAYRYRQQSDDVRRSLQRFWNARLGYLYDRITPDDHLDTSIRPNAVLAISYRHCAFSSDQVYSILQVARDRLLTPYGLRTLSPDDRAYIGHYSGSVRMRDLAAYQGTVHSWLIGPFVRSWQRFCDPKPVPFDWQPLLLHLRQEVSFCGISELFDGDAPHTPRGAISSTVAIAELLRCGQGRSAD